MVRAVVVRAVVVRGAVVRGAVLRGAVVREAVVHATGAGRGREGFWFLVLIGGFLFFLLLHGLWILAALRAPYLGGAV